jgi:hypothetical protein
MTFFFYGSTCHRLQALLKEKLQEEESTREEREPDEKQSKIIETLVQSIAAVEKECQKLDFWEHDEDKETKRESVGKGT